MSLFWLDSIFGTTNTTTQGLTVQINGQAVDDFRTLLNTQARIRLFVGTGGSFGNQSATVNLLYRLTNPLTDDDLTYAYAGLVDIYYDGGEDTLNKLYDLLPQLGRNPNGQVNNATVALIPYDPDTPPGAQVTFGFTGAVDANSTNFAAKLNVDYFLQLQPYNYNYAEKIFFLAGRDAIDLRAVPALNDPSFARRVSYIPPSTYNAPDWAAYADDVRAQILRYLTGDDVLQQVRLVVSYAIMPSNQNVVNSSPEAAAAVLCGGLLAWQDGGSYHHAAPVVVVNLNRFGDPDSTTPVDAITSLLDGGMTRNEVVRLTSTAPQNVAQAQQVRQVFEARRTYMKALDSVHRFSTLNYPQTLAAVQDAVGAISGHQDRVLFIQLGPVPQPLFYYALSRTNMVSLFEGANSTMAAINMGKPFLALPRRGAGVVPDLYPNVNRGFFSASPPINALASAANQLNFDLDSWPTGMFATGPCADLAGFLQKLTDETSVTEPINAYFFEIQGYYATSAADKLNVALAYLMNVYTGDHPPELRALAAAGDEAANPLNALYAELAQLVVLGQILELVPAVIAGGNIATAILGVLAGQSATLWLTVLAFEHQGEPDAITQITLTGTTGVLEGLGVENTITVVFDAPDGQLRCSLELGSSGTWSIAGVPWIQMSSPFVRVLVSDGQIPVTATLGGTYDPLAARLSVLVPVVEDQWLVTAAFDAPFPSIDRAFQMAASVNLVQVLPPPLNTLADLGLARVDLYYDSAAEDVPAIGFLLQSNSTQPLPLVGQIALSGIEAQIAIVNPKTALQAQVAANGTFTIGTGPDAGVVVVGVQFPGFVFNGRLTSGHIELADLLELFLPGVSLDLLSLPDIDAFDFNYTQATDNLSVAMDFLFSPPWTFDFFGEPLFTLENVGFSIARSKGENNGSITATTTLLPSSASPLAVVIGAYYLGDAAWRFAIQQQEGTIFSINALLAEYLGAGWTTVLQFPDVTGLALQLDWGSKQATSFEFAAATASVWTPIPVLPDVTVTGNLKLGYRGAGPDDGGEQPGAYGELGAQLTLWNIQLQVSYNFDPTVQSLEVRWLSFVATLEQNADKQTVATFTLDGQSVGSLVETFVSWATGAQFGLAAPWDVLNSITLNGVALTYNFSLEQVSFDIGIGPIDFGLFEIDGLGLKYDPNSADRKVEITLDGSFAWQSGGTMSWDPSKPETTPAPPGGGNKYLDLRLAALGQHVTVPGLVDQQDVQGVIALLRDLQVPNPPDIPVGGDGQPVFAPDSDWFVAFDFGVLKVEEEQEEEEEPPPETTTALVRGAATTALVRGDADAPAYFIQLSIVFNDPTLYALRIALDGPMAKIFAGLDFQIMYRQVSDTVGCYSAKLALPNLMRKFQIGVATITLPDFGIDVYTNGDFQVDIGFPWNQDFSRSFTIELVVPPGIPVMGSAGFYFGKLSSATTDKVPVRTTGWFNPVLVFGFGAQIGLGKSIDAGILQAGFSITVFGIIEGVLARWLPYNTPTPDADKGSLQDGYYFSITGTMGIQGRLYGTVDFAIVKADVDVSISIFARITFASYEDIPITAQASVNVRVTITINLGLFKIKVSFSFSATIEATFVLANPMSGPPPWGDALTGQAVTSTRARALNARRRGRAADELHRRRIQRGRAAGAGPRRLAAAGEAAMAWNNLLPGSLLTLQGWTAPVLTAAGDQASAAANQAICYVVNFFLGTPPPVESTGPEVALQAGATRQAQIAHAALARARRRSAPGATGAAADDATFEDLAVRVVQWVIAAGQPTPLTPDGVDALIVTDAFLAELGQYLSGSSTATPIPASAVETFLSQQTAICFAQTDARASADAVFFPAPPGTTLHVPDYGAWPGYDYTFGGYNTTGDGYLEALNAYFKALQVQVGAESAPQGLSARAASEAGPSIASYVFGDYFASLASQAVQALRDGLSNFKLVIDGTLTLQGIADWINQTGQLAGGDAVTCGQLFVANQDHPLSIAASGPLVVPGMTWAVAVGQSFDAIAAQPIFGGGFTAKALAQANAGDARILAPNQRIVLGTSSHLTQTGDSLQSIALALGVSVSALLDGTDVLASTTLLLPLAVVVAPDFTYAIAAGDTPSSVAARFGVGLDGIAAASAGVSGMFDSAADPNLNVPLLVQFQVGALIDEARRTLALQNLGAMMSRYYLHGLRLPTDGLTANARGLFVTGSPGDYQYPSQLGLFALTGQAFPLPDIADPDGGGSTPVFQYTLARGASETWLSLGAPGSANLTFQLTDEGDYLRYTRVAATAHGGPLATGTTSIAPSPVADLQPTRFPLSTEMPWQTPVAVTLPRQPAPPTAPQPRLWSLPGAMINTPHDQGPLPRFEPVLARTDQASGTTVDQSVGDYGFGTLITFTVRKSVPAEGSPTSQRLYELVGAPDRDIVLLERLLDQLGTRNDAFQQMQVLYQPASTGSDVKGWQMDAPAATLAGISQVNLSTETAPPSTRMLSAAGDAGQPANIINTPLEFLRLLWEASITRQGGFYLGYSTGLGSGGTIQGLPESTFNDRGEAQLAVLSLFVADGDAGQLVANYMNVVATDEPLDTSDAAFVARAVLADAETDPLADDATLATVAAAYYTGVDLLAARNATAPLAPNAPVAAAGGLYEVPPTSAPPGGGLQAIADHFFTTIQALEQANPHRASWPDPLPPYTALALPPVIVAAGTSYPNGARFTSLADVAAYFGAPIAEVAAVNAGVAGLFPTGTTLSVQIGPADLTPVTQPGVTGLDLTRAAPPAIPDDPADPDWGRIYLLNFFNLLGYRVADTPDFTASNWGLSGGPGDDEAPASPDKIRAPLPQAAEGDPWRYTRTLPYPAFSKFQSSPDVLPASTVSPYWGVGGLLQIELVWVDLFGNKILTELDAPAASGGAPLNFPPQLTGYTDRLLGLGQWPAVANAFGVAPDDAGQPALTLSLAFDQSAYTGATEEKLQQAIGIYTQILQQLHDPNGVAITLSTSVTPGAASVLTDAQVQALLSWAEGIYAWLCSLLPSTTANLRTVAAGFTPELDLCAPLDVTRLNDAQIFLVTASVTFARQAQFVNAELDAVPGVASVSTSLAPATGPLTGGDQVQRDLGTFAADFTRAFAAIPDRSYRVAEGARRDAFTDTGTPNVWAVQLGTATGEAISYRVQNPGDPIQYAPRPISNQLASKSKTPIIPYVTGTVIQPSDPPQNRAFTSIDLDQWMSSTLSRIDELLTPKYVAPAQILCSKLGTNSMQAVLDAKQALAKALESAMIAVFADESPTGEQLAAIQEVFYQRMLSALGEFYTVRAGIQFQAQVTAAIQPLPDDGAAPRLYGDVLLEDPEGIDPDPNASSVSLTSPKLDLALAGGAPEPIHDLSFLLSSARLDAAKVTLALRYNGRAIEHEIGELPGIEGYRPSSWLSFVDATGGADWPLTQPLGTFETPIVLRAFPETPALLVQESAPDLESPCHVPPPARLAAPRALADDACPKPGTYDPLANVTRWNYRFQYSLTAHDERDAVHGQVAFNVADPGGGALQAGAPARDLFDNLAEFVSVYPTVLADLDTYLVPIDVNTTDPVALNNANAALLSAANMIQWIADTAAAGLAPPSARLGQPDAIPPFEFTLTQDGVQKTQPSGDVTALRVTLAYAAPLPDGVGAPFVEIQPDTYDCEPDATSADGRSFVYKDRATGDYLTLEKGLAIPARALVLPDMSILERQDAGTGIYLTRNEELVDGRRSAAPFIYQTPLVEFPAPLHPTLDSSAPVNLATIDALDADHPVDRSLSCQLGVLYETLFADAGTDSVTLALTVYYEYRMHPALSKVRLPVYLQPPTQVSLAEGGAGLPLSDLIARQVSGCEDWLATHQPSTTEGTLLFDLVVMSDLTARPMPSLRLRGLFLDLANVTPPAGTSRSQAAPPAPASRK